MNEDQTSPDLPNNVAEQQRPTETSNSNPMLPNSDLSQTPFGQPSAINTAQYSAADNPRNNRKPNPPVAAQILYALGFLGLIVGLLAVVLMLIGTSNSEVSTVALAFGLSSLNIKLAAMIFASIVVGMFTLINFIRAGKKWALIAYTSVIGLSVMSLIYDYATRTTFEKLYSNDNPAGDILVYGIIVLLLTILWTKNRKSFH